MKLSEKLARMRAERPSEWLMDEYIRDAHALEKAAQAVMEACHAGAWNFDSRQRIRLTVAALLPQQESK